MQLVYDTPVYIIILVQLYINNKIELLYINNK